MDVAAYLRRIRYKGPTEPSGPVLRDLQRAHLIAVPFENLDISSGREIKLDVARFEHKIVHERRGGFCYELNGAFAELLRALGFRVTLLSARVPRADGSESPEFDHLALRVDLEEPWLADVGFGDSFLEPLHLQPGLEQRQGERVFRIVDAGGGRLEVQRSEHGSAWKPEYSFSLQPRQLGEFAGMCRFHQSSPESHFTRKRVCSLATPEGRITLSDRKLIVTRNGRREERELTEAEYEETLRERFGIVLPEVRSA
jgi:N-hydroxyarylamine O-acetyltransferase